MDQYESSIARTYCELSGIEHLYDGNIPVGFCIPSLYFPPPPIYPQRNTFNSYDSTKVLYTKVFGNDQREAAELAEKIVRGIMKQKCLIKLYSKDGSESGSLFKVSIPQMEGIEDGVVQITLEYTVVEKYTSKKSPKTQDVNINKNYD